MSGELEIVVSADIGDFGPQDGEPVIVNFSPLYQVQGLLPWLLLPLSLLVLRENRTVEAIWIIVPLLLVGQVYWIVMMLMKMDSGGLYQLNVMFTIMVVGFALVWLWAERIRFRNRWVRWLGAALIYYAFLGVTLLCNGFSKDVISVVGLAALSVPAILLALGVASAMSRQWFSMSRFIIQFGIALWGALLVVFAMAMFVFMSIPELSVYEQVFELLMVTFFSGIIYWAGCFPFLILIFVNPFWQRRFTVLSEIRINGKEGGESDESETIRGCMKS